MLKDIINYLFATQMKLAYGMAVRTGQDHKILMSPPFQ